MPKKLTALFAASLSLICLTAQAVVLLEVDLSVSNQVTITATTAASPVTRSGGTGTGFYLADFFGGTTSAFLDESVGSGDLTTALYASDNSPLLFRAIDDPGVNVYNYTSEATSGFTAGEQAFSGTATWTINPDAFALAVAGPQTGNVYFPADRIADIDSAALLGTWVVIPEPRTTGFIVALAVVGVALARRRRR